MAKHIIDVENISKRYSIGRMESYGSLRDEIMQALASPFRRKGKGDGADSADHIWALKDVSFTVEEGEVLGVIGRNGAGKSTLLKILSRITEPTTGRITMRGRVASLLEVGTGFHPELTGRENIFLNGTLLGMSNSEIKAKFDEIVAFSEIEKFLDTPVKRYSSGMYVRLAFAVAAHLEPEILIIDEVLAVGDSAFQKKCLGKMGDVAKGGRTVLFVSHNMGAVRSLCNSAVLFTEGSLAARGEAGQIVDKYLISASGEGAGKGEVHWPDAMTAPGGKEMRLVSIRVLNRNEEVPEVFNAADPIKIEITFELFEAVKGMRIILQIINSEGIVAFTSINHTRRDEVADPGLIRATCMLPEGLLNSGVYHVFVHSGCPGIKVLVQGREFVKFEVEKIEPTGWLLPEKWPGVVAPKLFWERQLIRGK